MKQKIQPAEQTYWAAYRLYLLGFVVALALFGVAAIFGRFHTVDPWEVTIIEWFNNLPASWSDVAVVLTMLGSVWAAAVLVIGAFVCKLYQLALRLALYVVTTYGLALLVKLFIDKPQPYLLNAEIQQRIVEVGTALPSLHVAIATVLAFGVFGHLPHWWRWPVVITWVAIVAVARMYLGVSGPLDVLSGLALGVGVVCFWFIIPDFAKRWLRLAT